MIVERYKKNPILKPNIKKYWETTAVFNCSPVKKDNKIYLVYRAISSNFYHNFADKTMEQSIIGITESKDGINFSKRKQFIYPENDWEKFGCEDPRITKIEDKYYIFYTALSTFPFSAEGIKVAVAISKDLKKINEKHIVTTFNAKAMTLFPEKINNKLWVLFSYNTDQPPTKICFASFDKEKDIWSKEYWENWEKNSNKFSLSLQRNDKDHVEIGAAPIKTKKGWLLLYSYIQNYFTHTPLFGIEAVLLDLKNPLKVIGRTKGPIMIPAEYYEKIGIVPNIVFPSGALLKDNKIHLYYGAADTVCSLAFIDLSSLLDEMLQGKLDELSFKRPLKKPLLESTNNKWEKKAVFNPAAIYLNEKVHIIYRTTSEDNKSYLGYATTKDGIKIDYRDKKPIYSPRENFEKVGCEDPRITKIGNKIYMLYTAYDGINFPRIALTNIKEEDFINKKWKWSKSKLISPANIDDKDACLFPEKINGKYYILHRIENGIDLSARSKLSFNILNYLEENNWMEPRKGWWDCEKVGVAAPPIKTKKGWILLYHGISKNHSYNVGAVLLDLKDPFKIIAKTDKPIFVPEESYEKEGVTRNVVFPCGAVGIKDKIFIYYGAADKVIGVATIKINELLKKLYACRCSKWKK